VSRDSAGNDVERPCWFPAQGEIAIFSNALLQHEREQEIDLHKYTSFEKFSDYIINVCQTRNTKESRHAQCIYHLVIGEISTKDIALEERYSELIHALLALRRYDCIRLYA
jgi:hypothetical protein